MYVCVSDFCLNAVFPLHLLVSKPKKPNQPKQNKLKQTKGKIKKKVTLHKAFAALGDP